MRSKRYVRWAGVAFCGLMALPAPAVVTPYPHEVVVEPRFGNSILRWSEFYLAGHGWVPVDASEARKHPEQRACFFGALDENRVQLSVGRDLVLSPPQADAGAAGTGDGAAAKTAGVKGAAS